MELPLDDGLEVGLHLLTGNLHIGCQSQILGLVKIRSDDVDLVVGNFVQVPHDHQLGRGVLGGPHLVVHVGLADDLTLEGSGKGHGDGQLLDLDLFQRFLRPQLHECLLDGTLRFFNANIQKTHLFCFFVDYPTIFLFCG